MHRIDIYMAELINLLRQTFCSRLLYIGLQGGNLSGEADEKSDIDRMITF